MTTRSSLRQRPATSGAPIVRELFLLDTHVRVLTRPGSCEATRLYGENPRVEIVEAHCTDPVALTASVDGMTTVVSALSETRPVIIDAQRAPLAAALSAGVPRFHPVGLLH